MKLFKFIADSGLLSRRRAQEEIKNAMVTVNDELILDPFHDINIKDDVRYDQKKVKQRDRFTTILLHKPKGYISTKSDEKDRKTIFELIPSKYYLNHVGRLDKDTTGAILLTDDGQLSQFLMHPKNKIEKEYLAVSDKFLDKKTIDKIKRGIFIGSNQKGKAKIISQEKIKNRVEIKMILRQGKKNEIRRIFKFLDLKLFSLKRERIGEILLGDLPKGSWRELSKKEIKYLQRIRSKS
tara:strand:+ start:5957 stop:6670 length:714 start_codon:yes stop_codon:yes gene_type:complete